MSPSYLRISFDILTHFLLVLRFPWNDPFAMGYVVTSLLETRQGTNSAARLHVEGLFVPHHISKDRRLMRRRCYVLK